MSDVIHKNTEDALQHKVAHLAGRHGISGTLKAQLRFRLIENLQKEQARAGAGQSGSPAVALVPSAKSPQLQRHDRALLSLVFDFLQHEGLHCGLSVLLPESGMADSDVLGAAEILAALSLQHLSVAEQKQKQKQKQSQETHCEALLRRLTAAFVSPGPPGAAAAAAAATAEAGTQTEGFSFAPEEPTQGHGALAGAQRGRAGGEQMGLEERLLQFQVRCEARCRREAEAELARVRTLERERLVLEEAQRCRGQLQESARRAESELRERERQGEARERAALERLRFRELELEKRGVELRSEAQHALEDAQQQRKMLLQREDLEEQRIRVKLLSLEQQENQLRQQEESMQARDASLRAQVGAQRAQWEAEAEGTLARKCREFQREEVELQRRERAVAEEEGQRATLQDKVAVLQEAAAQARENLRSEEGCLRTSQHELMESRHQLARLMESSRAKESACDLLNAEVSGLKTELGLSRAEASAAHRAVDARQQASHKDKAAWDAQVQELRWERGCLEKELKGLRNTLRTCEADREVGECQIRSRLESVWQLERSSLQGEVERLQRRQADADEAERRWRRELQHSEQQERFAWREVEELRRRMAGEAEEARRRDGKLKVAEEAEAAAAQQAAVAATAATAATLKVRAAAAAQLRYLQAAPAAAPTQAAIHLAEAPHQPSAPSTPVAQQPSIEGRTTLAGAPSPLPAAAAEELELERETPEARVGTAADDGGPPQHQGLELKTGGAAKPASSLARDANKAPSPAAEAEMTPGDWTAGAPRDEVPGHSIRLQPARGIASAGAPASPVLNPAELHQEAASPGWLAAVEQLEDVLLGEELDEVLQLRSALDHPVQPALSNMQARLRADTHQLDSAVKAYVCQQNFRSAGFDYVNEATTDKEDSRAPSGGEASPTPLCPQPVAEPTIIEQLACLGDAYRFEGELLGDDQEEVEDPSAFLACPDRSGISPVVAQRSTQASPQSEAEGGTHDPASEVAVAKAGRGGVFGSAAAELLRGDAPPPRAVATTRKEAAVAESDAGALAGGHLDVGTDCVPAASAAAADFPDTLPHTGQGPPPTCADELAVPGPTTLGISPEQLCHTADAPPDPPVQHLQPKASQATDRLSVPEIPGVARQSSEEEGDEDRAEIQLHVPEAGRVLGWQAAAEALSVPSDGALVPEHETTNSSGSRESASAPERGSGLAVLRSTAPSHESLQEMLGDVSEDSSSGALSLPEIRSSPARTPSGRSRASGASASLSHVSSAAGAASASAAVSAPGLAASALASAPASEAADPPAKPPTEPPVEPRAEPEEPAEPRESLGLSESPGGSPQPVAPSEPAGGADFAEAALQPQAAPELELELLQESESVRSGRSTPGTLLLPGHQMQMGTSSCEDSPLNHSPGRGRSPGGAGASEPGGATPPSSAASASAEHRSQVRSWSPGAEVQDVVTRRATGAPTPSSPSAPGQASPRSDSDHGVSMGDRFQRAMAERLEMARGGGQVESPQGRPHRADTSVDDEDDADLSGHESFPQSDSNSDAWG